MYLCGTQIKGSLSPQRENGPLKRAPIPLYCRFSHALLPPFLADYLFTELFAVGPAIDCQAFLPPVPRASGQSRLVGSSSPLTGGGVGGPKPVWANRRRAQRFLRPSGSSPCLSQPARGWPSHVAARRRAGVSPAAGCRGEAARASRRAFTSHSLRYSFSFMCSLGWFESSFWPLRPPVGGGPGQVRGAPAPS